jgi:peptidoglycan/xylan/chitin deacetylase (PgdA/CDA1 family)
VRRLRQHGLVPIGWDVYPGDDLEPIRDGSLIAQEVIRDVQPGSIILFHDGFTHALRHEVPQTVKALRTVIPALRARGYEFVTVCELLGLEPYKN